MGDEERKSDIIRKLEKIKNFESKATARSKFRLNQVPPTGRQSIYLTRMDGILSSIETDGTSTQTQFVQPSVFSSSNSSVMTENSVNGMNGMISNGGSPIKPARLVPLFEMIDTQQIIIAPKNNLQKANTAYSKTTQTEDERVSVGEFSMGSQEFDYDEFSVGEKVDINFDESPHHELAKFLPNLRLGIRETQDENEPPQEERIPELSEDEKRQILQSEDFSSFFLKAGRVMIRELAEINETTTDYGFDYSINEKQHNGELITLQREFTDKDLFDRAIGALDYSTFHQELFVAAYNRGAEGINIHPGIVHVWNTKFKSPFPEYTFTAPSPITSVQFARYHSNIIIGGLHTGQVCVWDNRVNKKTPVQKSPLIATAHTQPIYALSVVGTRNAHDLVTISTDGKMCSWALDNLTAPIETTTLAYKQRRQLPIYCMGFWNNGTSNFVAGSYEGQIYIGDRHSKGDMPKNAEMHKSLVTGLDFHKAPGASADFTNLCLSCSWDWSIKLNEISLEECKTILTFNQHHAFVQDVKWSPVHPATFASIDSDGQLMIWNLNHDTESPMTRIDIGAAGQKILWNGLGTQLIVGDNQGRVLLYDVHESISSPKSDEWEKMRGILREVQTASNEVVNPETRPEFSLT